MSGRLARVVIILMNTEEPDLIREVINNKVHCIGEDLEEAPMSLRISVLITVVYDLIALYWLGYSRNHDHDDHSCDILLLLCGTKASGVPHIVWREHV